MCRSCNGVRVGCLAEQILAIKLEIQFSSSCTFMAFAADLVAMGVCSPRAKVVQLS